MKEYNVLKFTDENDFLEAFSELAQDGWVFETFFPIPLMAALLSYSREDEEAAELFQGLGDVIKTLIGQAADRIDEDGPVDCLCVVGPGACSIPGHKGIIH